MNPLFNSDALLPCTGLRGIRSNQTYCVVCRRVAGAGGDEVLDGVDGLDAAAGAEGGAVEGGGGAGEIELALQGPALQEAVDKTSVENVSGTGGVNRLHAKSGCVVELRPVPS